MSVAQLWCLASEIQPVAVLHDGFRTRSEAQAITASECPSALTGGAQQVLNAAINLHRGGFESVQGVCDRRYVSGNEV